MTRVGRADLHRSHVLMYHGAIWWCAVCGSWTSTQGERTSPKALKGQCRRAPTRAGRDALRRLARGRPPKAALHWAENLAPSGLPAPRVRLNCKTALRLEELATEPLEVAPLLQRAAAQPLLDFDCSEAASDAEEDDLEDVRS